MAQTNPFQTVLEGLLEDLFSTKGVNSPFSQQIRRMQSDIQQRITNPVEPRQPELNLLQSLTNQQETAPKFSPGPTARPDPNAGPKPIRDPRFRPNLPKDPLTATKLAQAGPETMTDAPRRKPLIASPELVKAVIQIESSSNPNVKDSPKGAIGLMQVLRSTGADAGFGLPSVTEAQLRDPIENVKFGTSLLSAMLNRYNGDEQRVLIAYNAGHTVADAFNGDVSSLPTETQGYLKKAAKLRNNPALVASSGPGTPSTAPSTVPGVPAAQTPAIAPQAPSAGRAVTPPRPQRPAPVKAPDLPPPPDFNLEVPTLAQTSPRRPTVPVLWQQAVAKFQQSRDPKDLASVPRSGLPAILALMGRVARRSHA